MQDSESFFSSTEIAIFAVVVFSLIVLTSNEDPNVIVNSQDHSTLGLLYNGALTTSSNLLSFSKFMFKYKKATISKILPILCWCSFAYFEILPNILPTYQMSIEHLGCVNFEAQKNFLKILQNWYTLRDSDVFYSMLRVILYPFNISKSRITWLFIVPCQLHFTWAILEYNIGKGKSLAIYILVTVAGALNTLHLASKSRSLCISGFDFHIQTLLIFFFFMNPKLNIGAFSRSSANNLPYEPRWHMLILFFFKSLYDDILKEIDYQTLTLSFLTAVTIWMMTTQQFLLSTSLKKILAKEVYIRILLLAIFIIIQHFIPFTYYPSPENSYHSSAWEVLKSPMRFKLFSISNLSSVVFTDNPLGYFVTKANLSLTPAILIFANTNLARLITISLIITQVFLLMNSPVWSTPHIGFFSSFAHIYLVYKLNY